MEDMQNAGGNPGGSQPVNHNQDSEKPNQARSDSAGFEPMDLEPKKPSSLVTIATVIIVVAVIIIISNAIREDNTNQEGKTIHNGDLTVEIGESHVEETGDSAEEANALAADFLTPEQFSDLERAERIINSTQGKNPNTKLAEFIQTGIVADPEKEGIYYFATSTPNAQSSFAGIYQYNIANAYWHRLLKKTFLPDTQGHTAMWRVLGQEGQDLIIMNDKMNREVGSCESLWLKGTEDGFGLFTLNIDKPLKGFAHYDLPESLRASEQEKVDSCLRAK